MLAITVAIKTVTASGIFSPPFNLLCLMETKKVQQKWKCTKKSVAHLVKAVKTGQKTGLYFSQEQVRSYRTKMEVKNKSEIMIKMRYLFLVQNSNLVENSLYHFNPDLFLIGSNPHFTIPTLVEC